MKMKRITTLLMVAGAALVLSACGSQPSMQGTITSKYIEDYTEYTVVFVESSSGDVHHFQVDEDQWRDFNSAERNSDGSMKLNVPFNTRQLDRALD